MSRKPGVPTKREIAAGKWLANHCAWWELKRPCIEVGSESGWPEYEPGGAVYMEAGLRVPNGIVTINVTMGGKPALPILASIAKAAYEAAGGKRRRTRND